MILRSSPWGRCENLSQGELARPSDFPFLRTGGRQLFGVILQMSAVFGEHAYQEDRRIAVLDGEASLRLPRLDTTILGPYPTGGDDAHNRRAIIHRRGVPDDA